MKRLIAIILTGVLTASLLMACGGKPNDGKDEQRVLTFLFGDVGNYNWFTEEFPELVSGENEYNIKVEAEYQKDATTALQMKAAANEVPDLINLGLPQEMISQEKFVDLSNEAWWDEMLPTAKELSTDVKSGKNYYAPLSYSAVGLFYNTEVFEELGLGEMKTWEEFVAALTKIKENKSEMTPFYLAGGEAWTLSHFMEFTLMGVAKAELGYTGYESALASNDLDVLNWNTSAEGTIAKFGEGFMELMEKELINGNAVTASYDDQISSFANGETAVISQGMWALADIANANPDFKSIGFIPYPANPNTDHWVVGGPLEGQIAISSSSKDIEACKIVLNMILSDESIKSYCESRNAIPIKTGVDADWSFIKDEVNDAFNSGAYVGTWTQNLPGGFSSDENGRLVQNLLVNKYADSVEFAEDYLNMWNDSYNAAQN